MRILGRAELLRRVDSFSLLTRFADMKDGSFGVCHSFSAVVCADLAS